MRRYTRRAGFTAIELLIVLAIITLIGALTASAVFRVLGSQEKVATETTLTKLASALEVQWKAVLDAAHTEYDGLPNAIKQNLLALAENQTPTPPRPHPRRDDRARLLYVKLRLKQEFPTSFAAALRPAQLGTGNATVYYLPPVTVPGITNQQFTGKPSYVKAVNGRTLDPEKQSAALLLMALQESRKGVQPGAVDQMVGSSFIKTEGEFRYLCDAWGKPLQFFVFPVGNAQGVTDLIGVDPQDPEGLLKPYVAARANTTWRAPPQFATLLHQQIDGRKLVPIIVSAGPDLDLGGLGAANGNAYMDLPNPAAFDNLYSFRLRQTGARGD